MRQATPATPPTSPADEAVAIDLAVDRVIAERAHLPGALLPVLHGVQDSLGHVPARAVEPIARALNLSRAEVHGVVTYYHHFRSEPAGRHVVRVCRAESCKAMGAEALWDHACARLNCTPEGHARDAAHEGRGATSADGAFTLEPVFCLGLCASSPAIMVDDAPHARVNAQRFDRIVARAAAATATASNEGTP